MKSMLRTLVRGAYDVQKLRIEMSNRIVANFKQKLGQDPGKPEDTLDKEGKEILKELRKEYERISDGVVNLNPAKFKGETLISEFTEAVLIEQYIELESRERRHFARLEKVLSEYPLYNEFLSPIRGVGPAMSGVIISEIDITRAKYASSVWKYAGLDVAKDGRGRSRKAEHLIDVEYTAKDGEQKTKKSITFNPFLKTKLYVLAISFIKQGDSKYRTTYDEYKARLQQREDLQEHTKGHINNMAMRYMIKVFLADLYKAWRPLEGMPVYQPYKEEKIDKRPPDAPYAKVKPPHGTDPGIEQQL